MRGVGRMCAGVLRTQAQVAQQPGARADVEQFDIEPFDIERMSRTAGRPPARVACSGTGYKKCTRSGDEDRPESGLYFGASIADNPSRRGGRTAPRNRPRPEIGAPKWPLVRRAVTSPPSAR